MLDKPLDKFKEIIVIEKFDDTKVLTDTDNKLPDDIIQKQVVISTTCNLKDDGINFIHKHFQKKHFMLNKYLKKK